MLDVKDRVADNTSNDATVLTNGDLLRQFAVVMDTSFCGSKGIRETLHQRAKQNGIGFIHTINYKTGGKLSSGQRCRWVSDFSCANLALAQDLRMHTKLLILTVH